MDIDLGIIAAAIGSGRAGMKELSDSGIDAEMLCSVPAKDALEFIRIHAREHGGLPHREFLQTKLGIILPEVVEPLSVYIQEVRNRHLWNGQVSFSAKFTKFVNSRKPHEAQQAIDEYQRELRHSSISPTVFDNVWSRGKRVLELYDDAKAGRMGIRTPWPTINEMTLGWGPGDLVVYCSRLGTGKTWALLMMARQAFVDGYNVLFISPEMAQDRLAMRFYALHLGYSYTDVRHGRLGEFAEDVFRQRVMEMQGQEGVEVMGSGIRYTAERIEDAIAIARPDIVFLDGLYLVRGTGRNRSEAVGGIADDLKLFAGEYSIPIVASTQFNREVKPNDISTVHVGNVGLSDVISWNADMVFALVQTDDMRTDNEMMHRPLKIREGGDMGDVMTRWDFREMAFGEIGRGGADFDDGDYRKYVDKGPPADGEPEPKAGDPAIPF